MDGLALCVMQSGFAPTGSFDQIKHPFAMNPLDRINQLNNEVALLRSQLSDARKQLEADSATIAKLAKDKLDIWLRCDNGAECNPFVD